MHSTSSFSFFPAALLLNEGTNGECSKYSSVIKAETLNADCASSLTERFNSLSPACKRYTMVDVKP